MKKGHRRRRWERHRGRGGPVVGPGSAGPLDRCQRRGVRRGRRWRAAPPGSGSPEWVPRTVSLPLISAFALRPPCTRGPQGPGHTGHRTVKGIQRLQPRAARRVGLRPTQRRVNQTAEPSLPVGLHSYDHHRGHIALGGYPPGRPRPQPLRTEPLGVCWLVWRRPVARHGRAGRVDGG